MYTLGIRRSRATFSSAFTGTSNSASLSSRNPSTREIWSWVKSKTVGQGRYRRSQVRAEMFGQLTGGLEAAWSKLKGEVLTKENIAEPMRDIGRALLEADILHDELVKLMGGGVSELQFAKSGATVILLAGLQGVGKTMVCAKLACYLKKQGKSCMLIAGDVYRPATIDQLVILGEQVLKFLRLKHHVHY
ncbi:hypothetical protein ARALYDRAFT_893071 [Arabidopsis lyrata subsp. lyrata]|uniref:SRP54-type proteins GTP-binding domain-containing protein n=1 Tax=Arabidopsis lyrata subsp. lyrata TaxID=81972 RepID=D7KTE6_ARALL|nr:hypothetical protein ARALYDRAFT_893071 [Arabidopsis lyrata subsp. lyrata]